MTEIQKRQICTMRDNGKSYGEIADSLGVPKSTVKSFIRRSDSGVEVQNETIVHKEAPAIEESIPPASGEVYGCCRACGKELVFIKGRRRKVFCSADCRRTWWQNHPEESKGNAVSSLTCPECGKEFSAYGSRSRKYCSHECYIKARFGGAGHE